MTKVNILMKILSVIVIFILIAAPGFSQEEPLQLIIEPEKKTYTVGEEINITVRLKNVSQKEITVCNIWLPSLQIEFMVSRNGVGLESFDIKYELEAIRKQNYLRLEPGGSISRTFNILKCLPIEKPGTYTIKVSYKNWYDWYDDLSGGTLNKISVDAWKGTLFSNTVTIKVAK